MNQDPLLRVLLALILACLALLVAQGFGLGEGRGDAQGRYRITMVKGKKAWLMRVDSVTGRVEQLQLQGGGSWETLGAEEIELAGGEEPLEDPDEPAAAVLPTVAASTPQPEPPAPGGGSQAEIETLVESLQPGYPREIRIWAAELLGTYVSQAPETALPALLGALEDADAAVVVAAARALGRSRSPEAQAALRGLADHPSSEVRAAALEAVSAAP